MSEEAPREEGSSAEDRTTPAESSGRRLFLGGLSWETTQEQLLQHFAQFGEVEEAVVIKERGTERPRGFGFVTFKSEEDAQSVCGVEHRLNNRKVDVKKSVPQEHKPRSKKVFVGGLATNTTPEDLRGYFEQFGAVSDTQIMQDHLTKRSRGFGFITFADEAGAKAVFAAGEFHTIGSKQIQVKHATPRGSMPQPQPGSAAPGPGAGPSGSRMVFAPRPGFAGAYGGAVGQPGAYGPMGAYGPPVQYHVGPGYGMPAYGQAAFPGYGGLMVPHMGGGYSFQPGFAYGTGFPSQQMGGAGSYEQQQAQQQQLLALPAPSQPGAQARLQGQPAYGMPGSSRQNPRLPQGEGPH